MQALTSLIKLNNSWNHCIETISQKENVKNPITKLFLVEVENHLQFTLKEAVVFPDLIKKILYGESESSNFKVQLQKIKALFNSLQKQSLSEADQTSLKNLEEHLNALGSYVFVKRKKSILSFNRPESIEEFQLHYHFPTQLPPPMKINQSLINHNYRQCWLNAAIKYLASTTLYDKIICDAMIDPEGEGLRQKIFFVIEALRKDMDQRIVDSRQKELIEYLKIEKFSHFLQGEQDPNDFLKCLGGYATHLPSFAQQLQMATIYKSLDPSILKVGKEKPGSTCIEIYPTDNEKIDIQEQLSQKQALDNVNEYLINEDGIWRDPKADENELCFISQEVSLHLPDFLEISIVKNKNKNSASQKKINIDSNGIVILTEYEPKYELIDDQMILVDAHPKANCKYKAIAAIEHLGNGAERGHYVAYTRGNDNSITKHDDRSIQEQMSEKVWQKASLLQLQCIERTFFYHMTFGRARCD